MQTQTDLWMDPKEPIDAGTDETVETDDLTPEDGTPVDPGIGGEETPIEPL